MVLAIAEHPYGYRAEDFVMKYRNKIETDMLKDTIPSVSSISYFVLFKIIFSFISDNSPYLWFHLKNVPFYGRPSSGYLLN